jgi:hypothetical protein
LQFRHRLAFDAKDDDIAPAHADGQRALSHGFHGVFNLKRSRSMSLLVVDSRAVSRRYARGEGERRTWNKCPSGEKTVMALSYGMASRGDGTRDEVCGVVDRGEPERDGARRRDAGSKRRRRRHVDYNTNTNKRSNTGDEGITRRRFEESAVARRRRAG